VPEPANEEQVPEETGAGDTSDATEALDLEKVMGLWPAVVDQVRAGGSEFLSHALAAARPIAVDLEQAVLQVGFPASARFNKRKAEDSDSRRRFGEALQAIVGERLKPIYVLLEGEEQQEAKETITDEELFEKLKSEFDAEEFEGDLSPDADGGTGGMEAGLDAGPGMSTGEAAA
jgi:hypothetical protein